MPSDFVGYMRCADCGTLILASLGYQTLGRCIQCWKDRSPLVSLELVNASIRRSAASVGRHKRRGKAPKREGPADPKSRTARFRARARIADLFPDIYAMLLDEERVKLGLAPLARYELVDFEEAASKTLGFEDVYDALDSSGVSDA